MLTVPVLTIPEITIDGRPFPIRDSADIEKWISARPNSEDYLLRSSGGPAAEATAVASGIRESDLEFVPTPVVERSRRGKIPELPALG